MALKKTKDTEELLVPAVAASAAADTGDKKENSALNALLGVLTEELAEKRAEKRQKEEMEKKVRLEGAKAQQKRRDYEIAVQEGCNHRKPNNQPNIGGQRDHQGHIQFICQRCSKKWIGAELPPELRISLDLVGGPA